MGVTQHDRCAGNAAVRSADAVQPAPVSGDQPAGAADVPDETVPTQTVERFSQKARGLVLLGLFAWIPVVLLLALAFLS